MYEYRHLTPTQRAELVQQRLAKGYPPHSPPHPIQDQSFYLLTAACYEHKCHIKTEERRKQLLDLLFEQFTNSGIELQGWVFYLITIMCWSILVILMRALALINK